MLNCIKYEITQLYMLFLTRTTAAMHSVENSGRIFLNILQNLSFFSIVSFLNKLLPTLTLYLLPTLHGLIFVF